MPGDTSGKMQARDGAATTCPARDHGDNGGPSKRAGKRDNQTRKEQAMAEDNKPQGNEGGEGQQTR